MTKEELIKAINQQEEAMFLEQMKDFMDHKWYAAARERLNELKTELAKMEGKE